MSYAPFLPIPTFAVCKQTAHENLAILSGVAIGWLTITKLLKETCLLDTNEREVSACSFSTGG